MRWVCGFESADNAPRWSYETFTTRIRMCPFCNHPHFPVPQHFSFYWQHAMLSIHEYVDKDTANVLESILLDTFLCCAYRNNVNNKLIL